MRITFILVYADLTGGSRVISIYADRLQKRGHHVTIVSRPSRPMPLREKLRCLKRLKPIPKYVKYGPSHFDSLKNIEQVRINEWRPITADDVPDADVVIATWWETAEWVAGYPKSKGAKAYFLQHYETHLAVEASRCEDTWRLPFHKILIAQWLADLAKHTYHDPDFSLVPNSVDFSQFNAPPRNKHAQPTIGFMYSIVPFKGVDNTLNAIELARQAVPNLKVVSFGNRGEDQRLLLPIGTQYTVQPAQDKIKDIYSRCDAWIMGSRSEGFGLPILEAMACRTPVIATPTGAAPELLGDGGGVIVPHENPAAMAEQIVRIVTMANEPWRAMSDQAYAIASRYTWDDATDRFEAALRRAAEKGVR